MQTSMITTTGRPLSKAGLQTYCITACPAASTRSAKLAMERRLPSCFGAVGVKRSVIFGVVVCATDWPLALGIGNIRDLISGYRVRPQNLPMMKQRLRAKDRQTTKCPFLFAAALHQPHTVPRVTNRSLPRQDPTIANITSFLKLMLKRFLR